MAEPGSQSVNSPFCLPSRGRDGHVMCSGFPDQKCGDSSADDTQGSQSTSLIKTLQLACVLLRPRFPYEPQTQEICVRGPRRQPCAGQHRRALLWPRLRASAPRGLSRPPARARGRPLPPSSWRRPGLGRRSRPTNFSLLLQGAPVNSCTPRQWAWRWAPSLRLPEPQQASAHLAAPHLADEEHEPGGDKRSAG